MKRCIVHMYAMFVLCCVVCMCVYVCYARTYGSSADISTSIYRVSRVTFVSSSISVVSVCRRERHSRFYDAQKTLRVGERCLGRRCKCKETKRIIHSVRKLQHRKSRASEILFQRVFKGLLYIVLLIKKLKGFFFFY